MSENYELLIADLRRCASKLHNRATYARKSTSNSYGHSAFADRCHTLADAHESAAMAYEKILAQLEYNLSKDSP